MYNASTEVSLAAHSVMVKERLDHMLMVLFTKDNMDSDKPVLVVNLPPVRFIGGHTRQLIRGSIQRAWDPEISVYVVTMVGVPVEEALAYIGMKDINVVIHMDCGGEEYWIKLLG